MLYPYPPDTIVIGRLPYERPYENPISVRAGDVVTPRPDRGETTDMLGWIWCEGPDGRAGWTPEAWLDRDGETWVIRRDFSAWELSVEPGERFVAFFAESGFLFVQNVRGEKGWIPDGVVELAGD